MECQKHADEVFCSGNVVGVLPVGSITYKDKRVRLMGVTTPTILFSLHNYDGTHHRQL
ncbi:hypothetical protein COLO4_18754 [Corchorus olitorius]|uniref:Uncharacterized protein n=1 Tax=Corchorus olitorius TaxID=93759 RepID=A0A1R3J7Z7_9ROSI|nr:hypothetical protein COLO4_18754 [Corchorus olitorius]